MNQNTKEWMLIFGILIGGAGLVLLAFETSWKLALAVFLLKWADNISKKIKGDY